MTEYRYPPFLRGVIVACFPLTLLLALISWLAYWIDGAHIGLYMLPIWLLMAAYWGYTLATMPRWVRFEGTQVVIRHWRREFVMPYGQIHTVRLGLLNLRIASTRERVLFSRVLPNLVAAIQGELEQRVPVAQARFRHRFAEFPLSLRARRVAPIFSLGLGLLLVALGSGSLRYAWSEWGATAVGQSLVMVGMSAIWLAMGVGLSYAVLFKYVWRYTFTAATIEARYTLRRRQWRVQDLRALEWVSRESTYRGVTRVRWHIELVFADGEQVSVSPSQWGGWLDNSDVQDALILRQLLDRLRALYAMPIVSEQPTPQVAESG